jgi:hypothetical protein
VLKHRDRVIKKLKTRKVWQETMKFGIELLRTMQEALEIDCRMGTTYWPDGINKEMATVAHVFEFIGDDKVPIDHRFMDKVIKKEDGWVTNRLGVRRWKVTTKGVEFTIEWRDSSTSRLL